MTIVETHHLDQLVPLGALWPMVHRARRLEDEGYKVGILTNNVRTVHAGADIEAAIAALDRALDAG